MDFSVRKNIFPHTFINKGVWRKKSKGVENGHSKLEITRKIKKMLEDREFKNDFSSLKKIRTEWNEDQSKLMSQKHTILIEELLCRIDY